MAPARNDDAQPRKPKRHRKLPPKDTEEYRLRRDRNNDAVKKSRDKARERAAETLERVSRLKEENEKLEQQVQILSKELGVLRDLFKMVHAGEASGACGAAETGAAAVNHNNHDVYQAAESLLDMSCGIEVKRETGAASPSEGTTVNQEALVRDHEYFSTGKFWTLAPHTMRQLQGGELYPGLQTMRWFSAKET